MNPDDISHEIECSVCLEVPRNPIVYHCKNSHNICKTCYDTLPDGKACPTGRTCGFVVTRGVPQRNRTVEGLVLKWKHQCLYHKEGCSFSAVAQQIKRHEAICVFRRVTCRNNGCSFEARRADLLDHEQYCEFQVTQCKYALNGCFVQDRKRTLPIHEEECKRRMVPCPDGGCYETVEFSLLDQHVRKLHPDANWEFEENLGETHSWLLMKNDLTSESDDDWYMTTMKILNTKFVMKFQKNNNLWYTWLYILDGPRKAKDFFCEYSVGQGDEYSQKVKCTVLPIDMRRSQVVESANCLVMTNATMKKCCVAICDKEEYSHEIEISYKVQKR